MILRAIFLPLMGVGTVLVYTRPRYLKVRTRYSNYSRLWALKRVLIDIDHGEQQDGPGHQHRRPHQVMEPPPRRPSTLTAAPSNSGGTGSINSPRNSLFRSFIRLRTSQQQPAPLPPLLPPHQHDVILTEELQRVNLPPHAERISSSNCTGKTTSDNRDDTEEEEGNSYKDLERKHSEEAEEEEEKVPDR